MNVKICGLTTPKTLKAAVDSGARYVGFVFFKKSPRHLEIPAAARLAADVPVGVAKVALTVNASDAELDSILDQVPLDTLQLHGSEPPDRAQWLPSVAKRRHREKQQDLCSWNARRSDRLMRFGHRVRQQRVDPEHVRQRYPGACVRSQRELRRARGGNQ